MAESKLQSATGPTAPLDDEKVIEKFESYMLDDELHIVYENRLGSGHWGTGIRVYKIEPIP
jgi:hypothetical protein